jgi:hypothetical protein
MQETFFVEKKGAELNRDKTYRYKLWRIWDHTKPLVLFVGVNPSVADGTEDDNTIRRCSRFARDWGYGGFYMVNLFAWVATDPRHLKKKIDTFLPNQLFVQNEINNEFILKSATFCDRIVFIWGATGGQYVDRCQELKKMFPDAWCIRKTKEGHPEHPLYLKYYK